MDQDQLTQHSLAESDASEASTSKLKVLCIATAIHDYALEMVKALSLAAEETPAEITYIGPRTIAGKFKGYVPSGVEPIFLDWPRLRSPGNAALIWRIYREVYRRRPHIIYFPGNSVAWLSLFLWALPKCKVIATVHDVETHPGDVYTKKVPPFFDAIVRRRSDTIIVHSEELRAKAAEKFSRPPSDFFVMPHVALQQYRWIAESHEAKRNDRHFNVLFFGRILQYKGLEHLINAAQLAADKIPNLRVIIAGRGPDLDRCKSFIRQAELFDIHEGFVEEVTAAGLFQNADVVALPYVEASQSGVTAIATCFGIPVVASNVGDFRTAILDEPSGPFGTLVPPGDPKALADALVEIHHDSQLRANYGRNASASAEGPRSPLTVGRSLLEHFAFKVRQS